MPGAELRRRREALGLSQVQLGPLLGYTQTYISLLESGRKEIKNPVPLRLILEALERRLGAG
jgi:transcriptional regulator with XRE-family HTH domain